MKNLYYVIDGVNDNGKYKLGKTNINIMNEKEFYKNIRTNILGVFVDKEGNETVIYFDYVESENEIIAGTMCNMGIIGIVSLPFDNVYTINQHIETINEMLVEKGYFPM